MDARHDVLKAILARSAVDLEFRLALLSNPRAALESGFSLVLPQGFRIRFIERGADLDALVVLPDFKGSQGGDLDDRTLEVLSGGTGGRVVALSLSGAHHLLP